MSSLPVTAVGLECYTDENISMSLYLYPGYTLAYHNLPATKGAKPRLLLLTIDLPGK